MKLELGKDIAWELLDADRTCAIIIYDGKIYEDGNNHQSCLQKIFGDIGLNLDDEKDMAEAIRITDTAFREERFHGFDIFEHENGKYIASHYPQALENEKIFNLVYEYAAKKGLQIATFTNKKKLGDECRIVLNKI